LKQAEYPSLRTLIKLAKATNTDICALVALAIPDYEDVPQPNRDIWLLSLQIREVPDHIRKAVEALLAVAESPQA
jgi:hypothetical protein